MRPNVFNVLLLAVLAIAQKEICPIPDECPAPTSWLNVNFFDLPGVGECHVYGATRRYKTDCNLSCSPTENRIWLGPYLKTNSKPCIPNPDVPGAICRVTVIDDFYCGSAEYVKDHPDAPFFSAFALPDDTPIPFDGLHFVVIPKIYADIPPETPQCFIDDDDEEVCPLPGQVLFSPGDYDTGSFEYLYNGLVVVSNGQVYSTTPYRNEDYTISDVEDGQPGQFTLLHVSAWDMIHIYEKTDYDVSFNSSYVLYQYINLKLRMGAGHSFGGITWHILTSALLAFAFKAKVLASIVALMLWDPSDWVATFKQLGVIYTPTMVISSSELLPIMGLRAFGTCATLDFYHIMPYNSAHQDDEWWAEVGGVFARQNGLNQTGDAFSWSGTPNPQPGASFLWPTQVAYEDYTGNKWPKDGVTTAQQSMLSQADISMHFFVIWINIHFRGLQSQRAHLTLAAGAAYMNGRGLYDAYCPCGSTQYNVPFVVFYLLGLFDTYDPPVVHNFITNDLNNGFVILDGNFTLSTTQQTRASKAQCFRDQFNPTTAAAIEAIEDKWNTLAAKVKYRAEQRKIAAPVVHIIPLNDTQTKAVRLDRGVFVKKINETHAVVVKQEPGNNTRGDHYHHQHHAGVDHVKLTAMMKTSLPSRKEDVDQRNGRLQRAYCRATRRPTCD